MGVVYGIGLPSNCPISAVFQTPSPTEKIQWVWKSSADTQTNKNPILEGKQHGFKGTTFSVFCYRFQAEAWNRSPIQRRFGRRWTAHGKFQFQEVNPCKKWRVDLAFWRPCQIWDQRLNLAPLALIQLKVQVCWGPWHLWRLRSLPLSMVETSCAVVRLHLGLSHGGVPALWEQWGRDGSQRNGSFLKRD